MFKPDGPQRIVCLTEETTEWLYSLGQSHRIVGISGYTVRPAQARAEKPRVSAYLSAKIDKILAVEVYDYRGEVLFDTDRGAIGSKVSLPLIEALSGNAAQAFGVTDEDALIVGLPLINNLGKIEGGVVLRYPSAYIEHGISGLLFQLSKGIALQLAVFSVLAVAGLYLLFGRVGRKLAAMQGTLDAVIAVGGRAEPGPGADPFEEYFAEFVTKSHEAVEHIRDATAEVGRLDRLQ